MPTDSDVNKITCSTAADAAFVADYIDHDEPAIHPAFEEPAQFDKQRAIYRSNLWHQYVHRCFPVMHHA